MNHGDVFSATEPGTTRLLDTSSRTYLLPRSSEGVGAYDSGDLFNECPPYNLLLNSLLLAL